MSTAFTADPEAVYAFAGEFFDSLRDAGVAHIVLSPGSRSTPLSISADRAEGLRTWVVLDERSAAFFALGLAKATRQPAALVCTSGTAAANYLPAVIEAHYSRVPLVVLTADRPPELRDWGAGQTIDQTHLYGRYSRWSVEVPTPEAGDDALRVASRLASRAVEMSCAVPAGAVHLNWPLREPLAPPTSTRDVEMSSSTMRRARTTGLRFSRAEVHPSSEDVDELVALVRSCPRGVICCGPMDIDAGFVDAIASFARVSGWPILADPASQLRSAGHAKDAPILDMGDGICRAGRVESRLRPEVVLRIGDTPVSKAQRLWLESVSSGPSAEDDASALVAHWWLDEGGQWGEPSHRATRVVRGGAASLLAAARETLEQSDEGDAVARRESEWCRCFETLDRVARKAMTDVICVEESWSGLAVAGTVANSMPADASLFASNSMAIRLLDLAFERRREPLRVLCSRGASGIDGITSTALGIAAVGNPTVLLTGDLAFLHDQSALGLARRESVPLTIVVLDDNGGGIFSFLPIAAHSEPRTFDRLFRTPHDLDLRHVAGLFELDYRRVCAVSELESALQEQLATPRVSIIHAVLDAKTNEARFRECVTRVAEAVDASLTATPAA